MAPQNKKLENCYYLRSMHTNDKPTEIICRLTHCDSIPEEFGAPFFAVFKTFFPEHNGVQTASLACTLFLSALHCGFPTDKLHIFTREAYSIYPGLLFDCKFYDRLIEAMHIDSDTRLLLLNEKNAFVLHRITPSDITDAFDFITNI